MLRFAWAGVYERVGRNTYRLDLPVPRAGRWAVLLAGVGPAAGEERGADGSTRARVTAVRLTWGRCVIY